MPPDKNVIILDDDMQYHALLFDALTRSKKNVALQIFNDCDELVQYLHSAPSHQLPSLLIFHHDLKSCNVFEVLKRIRIMAHCKDIPFVIYSSSDLAQINSQYQELNALAVLKKQTTSQKLVEQIDFICNFTSEG